jgi:hypothetical protein
MNWLLIAVLSGFGLAMGIGTVSLIPSSVEPAFWLVIFAICAYVIARRAPGRFFLHGVAVSLDYRVSPGVLRHLPCAPRAGSSDDRVDAPVGSSEASHGGRRSDYRRGDGIGPWDLLGGCSEYDA